MDNITAFEVTNVTLNSTYVTDESSVRANAKIALHVTIIICQVSVMVGMGAVTTIQEIWHHLKKPTGLGIALASQFVLLPASAFGLLNILKVDNLLSLSVLIMCCCPGGTVSNLYAYLCDGDVSLSIVLTTVCTALAIGMTPLNLWMYSRHWQMTGIHVPYGKIAITLAWILIPLGVGMIMKIYRPKFSASFAKVASIIGMVLTWVTLVLQYFTNPESYTQSWELWVLSCVIPCVGFAIGYFSGLVFRQAHRLCRTIALETGIQSVSLATSIIITSFPSELHHALMPFAFMYGFTVISIGMILAIGVKTYQCFAKTDKEVELEMK